MTPETAPAPLSALPLPDEVAAAGRAHWDALDARGKRKLLLGARAGDLGATADEAAALTLIGKRELQRLWHLMRPVRLTVWRSVHLVVGAWFLLSAVRAADDAAWGAAVLGCVLGLLFLASGALAKRRLLRRWNTAYEGWERNCDRAVAPPVLRADRDSS